MRLMNLLEMRRMRVISLWRYVYSLIFFLFVEIPTSKSRTRKQEKEKKKEDMPNEKVRL